MNNRSDQDNGYSSVDFKRNNQQDGQSNEQSGQDKKLSERTNEYLKAVMFEKVNLDGDKFPVCAKYLDQEITRVNTTGRAGNRDSKFVDLLHNKPTKVIAKILIPVKEHPKFNFVGKLLGPKGLNFKRLQEETMCKMAILGRGSIRDRQKEDELRNSLDPKYMHLTDDLHVEITAIGAPEEAYARLLFALGEVKKELQPEPSDDMRPMPEMMERRGPPRPMPPARGPPQRGMPMGGMRGGGPPVKAKVMSILDRARNMDNAYHYDDRYEMHEPAVRPQGGRGGGHDDFYNYDRNQDRYYDDDSYFKEDMAPREFKTTTRDIGTRRVQTSTRHFPRDAPYARPPK